MGWGGFDKDLLLGVVSELFYQLAGGKERVFEGCRFDESLWFRDDIEECLDVIGHYFGNDTWVDLLEAS
jgi:hypothetical protein